MKKGFVAIFVLSIFLICVFILSKIWQLLHLRMIGNP